MSQCTLPNLCFLLLVSAEILPSTPRSMNYTLVNHALVNPAAGNRQQPWHTGMRFTTLPDGSKTLQRTGKLPEQAHPSTVLTLLQTSLAKQDFRCICEDSDGHSQQVVFDVGQTGIQPGVHLAPQTLSYYRLPDSATSPTATQAQAAEVLGSDWKKLRKLEQIESDLRHEMTELSQRIGLRQAPMVEPEQVLLQNRAQLPYAGGGAGDPSWHWQLQGQVQQQMQMQQQYGQLQQLHLCPGSFPCPQLSQQKLFEVGDGQMSEVGKYPVVQQLTQQSQESLPMQSRFQQAPEVLPPLQQSYYSAQVKQHEGFTSAQSQFSQPHELQRPQPFPQRFIPQQLQQFGQAQQLQPPEFQQPQIHETNALQPPQNFQLQTWPPQVQPPPQMQRLQQSIYTQMPSQQLQVQGQLHNRQEELQDPRKLNQLQEDPALKGRQVQWTQEAERSHPSLRGFSTQSRQAQETNLLDLQQSTMLPPPQLQQARQLRQFEQPQQLLQTPQEYMQGQMGLQQSQQFHYQSQDPR